MGERADRDTPLVTLDPWLEMFTVLSFTEEFSDTLLIPRIKPESFVFFTREHPCLSSWNRPEDFQLLELSASWRSHQTLFTSVYQWLWDPRMISRRSLMHTPPLNN